jgi:hypothetical protein
MELIRQAYIEDCAVLGAGDDCWSIEGCFNITFNTCYVGASFGAPGNVAVQGTWNLGWNITDDPNDNTGSNVNVWLGGKTKGGARGVKIDDTSYRNAFYNHSFAAQTTEAVLLDSTAGSPTYQWFDNCEFEDTNDVNDIGSTATLSTYNSSGQHITNAGTVWFNKDYVSGDIKLGPSAYYHNFTNAGATLKQAVGGDAAAISYSLDAKGAGSINIGGTSTGGTNIQGGYGGTGVTISTAGNITIAGDATVDGAATGTSLDLGTTTLFASRALTVDTGGVFDINMGSASGDDFTIDTTGFLYEGDTGNVSLGGSGTPAQEFEIFNGGSANFNVNIDTANTTVSIVGGGNTRDRDLDYYNTTTRLWSVGVAPTDGGGTTGTEYYIGETKGGANASIFITPTTSFTGIKDNTPAALLDVGGGTATTIDGTDDLLVKDDIEVDGNIYSDADSDGPAKINGPIFKEIQLDPGSWYDSSAYFKVMDVDSTLHADGVFFDEIDISFEVDPDVELTAQLVYFDAWIGKANETVMDTVSTTNGVFNESTPANINGGAAVVAGKKVAIKMTADPEGTGTSLLVKIKVRIAVP